MEIHNANAMSSPYTIGFPAMTAWLGGIHALERRVRAAGMTDVKLVSVAVSCHKFTLHTYRGHGDRYWSVVSTANPLRKKGSDWVRPAFIEEPRCDLTVSLLVEVTGVNGDNEDEFIRVVESLLHRQKMASGDIRRVGGISLETIAPDDDKSEKRLLRKLMPGYVPIERRDLMVDDGTGGDALDKMLDYLRLNVTNAAAEEDTPEWVYEKKVPGWIVPLAVGYKSLSKLGKVKNQRESDTLHCFAESVITLGEFKMPYRFDDIDEIMWSYDTTHVEDGLYLCTNQKNVLE